MFNNDEQYVDVDDEGTHMLVRLSLLIIHNHLIMHNFLLMLMTMTCQKSVDDVAAGEGVPPEAQTRDVNPWMMQASMSTTRSQKK